MQEINEELENDRSVLEWMLGQYVRAKRRKKQLEVRLLEINAERDSPIGGQGYDPLPRSGGNNEGAAGILMKTESTSRKPRPINPWSTWQRS